MLDSPQATPEAAAFLRAASEGAPVWKGLCLQLQRMARGLPAVYPSALAAAIATPTSERVTAVKDLRRGMVAYSDDPNDSNPFAHIYFIAGRTKDGTILTWTNDAVRSGGVDIVPITFYKENWGDTFMFGATCLNNYNFEEFDKKPVPKHPKLGDNYDHAIEDILKAIKYHESRGHGPLVKALKRDVALMKKMKAKYAK